MAIRIAPLQRARDALGLRWLRRCRQRLAGTTRRPVVPQTPAVIVGTLLNASGIGQGARLMLTDLAQRGVQCQAVDVTRQLGLPIIAPATADHDAGGELPRLPRIVHLNPPHFGRALRSLGGRVFAAPVVAYWAWELEAVPREWLASALLTDEIWVPSPFVSDAVLSLLHGMDDAPPVRVVPHAVAAGEVIARDASARRAARERLGMPPQAFVAGFTFSVRAGVRRKNPEAAIAAFQKAFPDGSDNSRLLLRCADASANLPAWAVLHAQATQDSRIRLVDPAACGIQDFFSTIDALLSLHRSEGYGLTLAEALRAGIPVIATAWSIAEEISRSALFYPVPSSLVPVNDPGGTYRNFRKLRWAEPDLDAAARYLRELQTIHRYHIGRSQA
jgi:glycosyltransferase involved in cell wall biosynthesis